MNKICNACGSNSYKDISLIINQGNRGSVKWLVCNECGSFFSTHVYNEVEEVNHTKNFTSWGNETKGKILSTFKIRMYKSIAQIIRKIIPPPAKLLDIGCSYGGFLIETKNLGYDVTGIDILPEAINFIQSIGIPSQVCFSIDGSDFNDESFDIISVLDCNCYWIDQIKEISSIFNKLKHGGILVMRVADKSFYLKIGLKLKIINNRLGNKLIRYSVNDHYFSMPVKSLINELKKIGFNINYASPKGAVYSYQTNPLVKILFNNCWSANG